MQSVKKMSWGGGTKIRASCEAMYKFLPSWDLHSRGKDKPSTISPGNGCFKEKQKSLHECGEWMAGLAGIGRRHVIKIFSEKWRVHQDMKDELLWAKALKNGKAEHQSCCRAYRPRKAGFGKKGTTWNLRYRRLCRTFYSLVNVLDFILAETGSLWRVLIEDWQDQVCTLKLPFCWSLENKRGKVRVNVPGHLTQK